jgi:hypothetical protein
MPKKGSALDVTHAKLMKRNNRRRSGGDRKWGRNKTKCERYRARVGKPLGPGEPGQKKHG